MLRTRVIPSLLLKDGGLVKTVRFGSPRYVGDPINAVRIFNDKEVDELVVLDIEATREGRAPDFEWVAAIAGEAFMPIGYGGGITTVEQCRRLVRNGVEKVIINSAGVLRPELLTEAAEAVGSQSVVASIDVKSTLFGSRVVISGGRRKTSLGPVEAAVRAVAYGAGEILLTSVDREGTRKGYDLKLIEEISTAVDVPVVALGGGHPGRRLSESGVCGRQCGRGRQYVCVSGETGCGADHVSCS